MKTVLVQFVTGNKGAYVARCRERGLKLLKNNCKPVIKHIFLLPFWLTVTLAMQANIFGIFHKLVSVPASCRVVELTLSV
jgi:hypothetical protein